MARPLKAGLDYFELDCHMDEKVELIEAEYGLKGFAIIVKLYQSIYSGFGYYCEWTPDISVLWAKRLGFSHSGDYGNVGIVDEKCALSGFPKNLINDVVAASIRRNIFSEELFRKYRILTSAGIQKRYLNATYRREKVELRKEYLLISVGKNKNNVVINEVSDINNQIKDTRNTQSKVKKSKEKKISNIVVQDTTAQSLPSGKEKIPYKEIVDYLNLATGKHYKNTTTAIRRVISGRFTDGFTLEDFKTVIDCKAQQWKDNPKMSQYLRPETLFAPSHFDSYLNEAPEKATEEIKQPDEEEPGINLWDEEG